MRGEMRQPTPLNRFDIRRKSLNVRRIVLSGGTNRYERSQFDCLSVGNGTLNLIEEKSRFNLTYINELEVPW